jgi:hypothetical protein
MPTADFLVIVKILDNIVGKTEAKIGLMVSPRNGELLSG